MLIDIFVEGLEHLETFEGVVALVIEALGVNMIGVVAEEFA